MMLVLADLSPVGWYQCFVLIQAQFKTTYCIQSIKASGLQQAEPSGSLPLLWFITAMTLLSNILVKNEFPRLKQQLSCQSKKTLSFLVLPTKAPSDLTTTGVVLGYPTLKRALFSPTGRTPWMLTRAAPTTPPAQWPAGLPLRPRPYWTAPLPASPLLPLV